MPTPAAYGGNVYIADASAWWRAAHPSIRDEWTAALNDRQIATCAIVKLEMLYSARDGSDYDRLDAILGAFRDVPINRSVTDAALTALRELAHRQPLLHRRVRFADVLIAAAAQDAAVGVLHYDAQFDRLAEVLEFESRWIAPSGSF